MTSSQRNYLRKHAHHLKPVVMVGQQGLQDGMIKATDEALASHELIKVKFQDFKEAKRELADQLAQATAAESVSIIGNILTLYRPAEDPSERQFKLPKA